jgi:hypothetical protein
MTRPAEDRPTPDAAANPARLVARYLAAWNEPDADRRRSCVASVWTEGGRYDDPRMQARGVDGIAAMIGAARQHFPGHAFAADGSADRHGDFLRFGWVLQPEAGGAPIARGTDFVVLAPDGERFASVVGFLDAAPAA